MSYQPKVYTIGHVVGMTAIVVFGTFACYRTGMQSEDAGLKWFTETWLISLGGGATILTFLYGLTILGTPWYDEETNEQLQSDHERAEFEWRSKSPEERAIITAARENELLQLTQIMQNNRIIQNQEQMKKKPRS